jgi:DNA modification methylase
MEAVQKILDLDLIKSLEADSVDVAILCPPLDYNPMATFQALSRVVKKRGVVWYVTEDAYDKWTMEALSWKRALNVANMPDWNLVTDCVMVKTQMNPCGHRRPKPVHEYVFMFARSEDYRYFDLGKLARSVWLIHNEHRPMPEFDYWQTPEELVEILIRMSCPEGGVVLDPLMGSGTTAVVAERLGRQCVGGDCDEATCRIANQRIEHGRSAHQY